MMGSGLQTVRGSFCDVGHGGVCLAIIGSVLDGYVERDEVVADDEKNEQQEAVADEHVEEGEAEAQKLQTLGVFAERDFSLLHLLLAAMANFM